jgi:hypothetical protein
MLLHAIRQRRQVGCSTSTLHMDNFTLSTTDLAEWCTVCPSSWSDHHALSILHSRLRFWCFRIGTDCLPLPSPAGSGSLFRICPDGHFFVFVVSACPVFRCWEPFASWPTSAPNLCWTAPGGVSLSKVLLGYIQYLPATLCYWLNWCCVFPLADTRVRPEQSNRYVVTRCFR